MFHQVKCSHYAVHRAKHDRNMCILTVTQNTLNMAAERRGNQFPKDPNNETTFLFRISTDDKIHGHLLVMMQNPQALGNGQKPNQTIGINC